MTPSALTSDAVSFSIEDRGKLSETNSGKICTRLCLICVTSTAVTRQRNSWHCKQNSRAKNWKHCTAEVHHTSSNPQTSRKTLTYRCRHTHQTRPRTSSNTHPYSQTSSTSPQNHQSRSSPSLEVRATVERSETGSGWIMGASCMHRLLSGGTNGMPILSASLIIAGAVLIPLLAARGLTITTWRSQL